MPPRSRREELLDPTSPSESAVRDFLWNLKHAVVLAVVAIGVGAWLLWTSVPRQTEPEEPLQVTSDRIRDAWNAVDDEALMQLTVTGQASELSDYLVSRRADYLWKGQHPQILRVLVAHQNETRAQVTFWTEAGKLDFGLYPTDEHWAIQQMDLSDLKGWRPE